MGVATMMVASTAAGQDEHRLHWSYPDFHPVEYAVTGSLIVNGAVVEMYSDQPEEPRWVGPVWFDSAVRDVLVGRDAETRDAADTWSDVAFYTAQLYTGVVDSLGVALIGDQNFEAASQTALLDVEANALGFFVTRSTHRLVARARSFHLSCPDDPKYSPYCDNPKYNASFFSGHTSMAFVGAGLTCAHHQYLPLYGEPAADVAACAGVTAIAATSGVLRIVADKHYTTDVLVGAVVGGLIGYGIPVLLHYEQGDGEEEPARTSSSAMRDAGAFRWSWATRW